MDFFANVDAVFDGPVNLLPQRIYNIRDNPFDLNTTRFKQIFRLDKPTARQLINVVRPYMVPQLRTSALDIETRVLAALRFFAGGAYQMDVGLNRYFQVSQASVSRSINEVINAMNTPQVMAEWIHFPSNFEDLRAERTRFIQRFGIPAVGCIDCTHIAIVPPNKRDPVHPERIFVNRKAFHSINVQVICDSNMRILNVNARFPGSVHDSHIWRMSALERSMQRIYATYPNEMFHLLGDSGYALRPWLMTPFRDPANGSQEQFFNSIFVPARTLIERTIGAWKARLRCGLKHRTQHYKPRVASKIINSCAILHNMCVENNVNLARVHFPREERFDRQVVVNPANDRNRAGWTARNTLMRHMVAERLRFLRELDIPVHV